MVTLVLHKPQIPPNTGNIMRLCSNTGFKLHLIKPFGFHLDDKSLKRAKLDYFSNSEPSVFEDLDTYIENISINDLVIITKFGKKKYTEAKFKSNSIVRKKPTVRKNPILIKYASLHLLVNCLANLLHVFK